jgi:sugar phosphate isomerase/epimerase
MLITRRQLMLALGSAAVLARGDASAAEGAAAIPRKTGLGLVSYCCSRRRASMQRQNAKFDLFEPFAFLEHCRQIAAGGIQVSLKGLDHERASQLRERVEQAAMYLEAIVEVPRDADDVARFAMEMEIISRAGALAARTTIIPGRRYEYFDSIDEYHEYVARGRRSVELAAPIAEKHRVPLAIENHKDQRIAERIALLEHIGSQYVGACVDTGNSVALLEDAQATVDALAPWAFSVHLKDQAVQPCDEGFLLGDIPLGQGFLELGKIVATLKQRKPDVRFSLELITRDPLKVPCLTDAYWVTFPDVPARDLVAMLGRVRRHAAAELQQVTRLTVEQQVALEDANVRASLDYARDVLGL